MKLNKANTLLTESEILLVTTLKTICFTIFDTHLNYANLEHD